MEQRLLNLLYTIEELAEKAVEVDKEFEFLSHLTSIRGTIHSLLENVEDSMTPEDHHNYSVVPLDKPSFSQGRNGIDFKQRFMHKGKKLSIMIHVDAYDFQSWARISVLDEQRMSWNHLDSIPYEHMESVKVFYQRPPSPVDQAKFYADRDTLREAARMLMFTPDEEV